MCFPKVKLGKTFPGILLDTEVGKKFRSKQIKVTSKPKCGFLLIKQGEKDPVGRIISWTSIAKMMAKGQTGRWVHGRGPDEARLYFETPEPPESRGLLG